MANETHYLSPEDFSANSRYHRERTKLFARKREWMMQCLWILSQSSLTPPLISSKNPKNDAKLQRSGLFFVNCSKALDKPQTSPIFVADAKQAAIARVKSASDLSSALSSADGILQVQDLNFILRYFGESRRWHQVSQVFDWMLKNENVNFASYSSFIKYMGISRNPLKALQVYNNIPDKSMKINVSVCNSVLGCMVRNGRFESSIKLFDQMKDDGLSPDLVTYSSLLGGCTKLKQGYCRAMQLVNELKDNGLRMDGVIYGNLLAICASNNLYEEAEVLFQQMKNEGYTPNLFHYSSLLNAYSEDGNYEKAELLIKEMKSLGLQPNKVILTTLLKVYAKGGLFEKSRVLLAELEALGYAKDEMPYCLLMDNLAKAGHIHEAKTIFAEMKEKNVKSDGYSYSIMLSALCRSGLLQEASLLAKDFEANYGMYDLVTLNTLLRVYCNTGDMDSAMQTLRKMDELSISPDWNTFHILIKYFCRERLYHLAYQTVEDMHSKGHQLDEELCTSLILQLGRAGAPSEALSVYNMLRYSKRRLCKSLHQKVLDILVAAGLLKEAYVVMKDNTECIPLRSLEKFAIAFMKSGNINSINDVLKAFHRSGCTIDTEIFRAAISRYVAKPEKKELLLQLLQWMSGQGYIVDSSSRNLLLRKSRLFGEKHLIAEILSKQHMMSRKLRSGTVTKEP
ncbi:pentatricopeptide repeat-containing protein At1g10910, chloroplastic [Asparagus officinalis]|uniref:pentatricopeptide repeat-containing protein At1g10910, chloroplastic n=1 Tax=Asparagus officinalis TaxID=4686 RepID=UPI00098E5AA5|nr:pentatricopeptide repeat-containing protein At1g10910, chloroplastic [Asparagus officinalis]XP_020272085.1 pentatricopeptide repeat-containing protein At1g10910, chloroplastic [Asparagus officinalis]XP_020272089.1 pentatricopeptide repeat-containing protein At1g10910, chloroplastic [Asparagus officinalis]XP_020272093.1 pentatricopeptide repeat-containing protein At1g10910, chloroplastic [Asparagus officinalis]